MKIKVIFAIFAIFCIFLFYRNNFGEPCVVPSGSMESALIPGDVIWVNKFISANNPFKRFFYKNYNSDIDRTGQDFLVDRYDVIVFHSSANIKDHLVIKRVLAIPKDTLYIANDDIYINGQNVEQKDYYIQEYVSELSVNKTRTFIKHNDINAYKVFQLGSFTHLYLKVSEANKALNRGMVLVRSKENHFAYLSQPEEFYSIPNGSTPITIPARGDVVLLNDSTYQLYGSLLKNYEGRRIVRVHSNKFFEGVKQVTHIRFKNNYYYFVGDNRPNSLDSRTYGMVSESLIFGRATKILYNASNLHRILKDITQP